MGLNTSKLIVAILKNNWTEHDWIYICKSACMLSLNSDEKFDDHHAVDICKITVNKWWVSFAYMSEAIMLNLYRPIYIYIYIYIGGLLDRISPILFLSKSKLLPST